MRTLQRRLPVRDHVAICYNINMEESLVGRIWKFFFRPIRLPAWLIAVWAGVILIPDVKARWDFWVEAWAHGWITAVLTSPLFSLGLFLVVIVYLFKVQPRPLHIHHRDSVVPTAPRASSTRAVIRAEWVPLPAAARRIYEANLDSLIGEFARSQRTPEEIVEYFAWYAVEKHLPIYGKRPPSNLLEAIPEAEIRRCTFQNCANELRGKSGDSTHWVELATTEADLQNLLAA